MKTMKYMTTILVASLLIISMHMNATFKYLPMQSTSAMQATGSTHAIQVREAYAPNASFHYIPMQSTSAMIETGYVPTPESEDSEGSPERHLRRGFINPSDPGDQSDDFPIGEPWILLLFAAATAATIALRNRRSTRVRQIVLTDAAMRH